MLGCGSLVALPCKIAIISIECIHFHCNLSIISVVSHFGFYGRSLVLILLACLLLFKALDILYGMRK